MKVNYNDDEILNLRKDRRTNLKPRTLPMTTGEGNEESRLQVAAVAANSPDPSRILRTAGVIFFQSHTLTLDDINSLRHRCSC